jgi:cyclopropane-fatty-acyl-phospholipid synthase
MIEDMTATGQAQQHLLRDARAALVTWGGRRLLRWQPEGSVTVTLPGGRTLRFGRSDGHDDVHLTLNNYKVITKSMRRGAIGFAEAYLDGDIECESLCSLFRFFAHNRNSLDRTGGRLFKPRLGDRLAHIARANSRTGSRRNIAAHYDLGNSFFRAWLDRELIYSSGYYGAGARTLAQAQRAKLELIAEFLQLEGGEQVLEIGCGWGGLARHLTASGQARVTGLTLSIEQLRHARQKAVAAGLQDKCRFKLKDYRDVRGTFDHVVAIEMIEAVGEAYWPRFFSTVAARLKPGGSAVIQAITIDSSRFQTYRRKPDFIQRYIFPGGMLPTHGIIESEANKAGLDVKRVELFGASYAHTLNAWRTRFEGAWPEIEKLGFDQRFRRLWRYYLAYCEAGFLEGQIDVGLYLLRKS